MTDEKPPWRQQLEQSIQEIKSMSEQVGEKMGAAAKDASTEARDAWQKLEPRIGEAEAKLREATDDAVDKLEGMVGELRDSFRTLRDKL